MLDFLTNIFSANGFEAHSMHFIGSPWLMWFLIAGDILIAIAYILLPAQLSYIYFKRRDFAFSWVFVVVAFFGIWCSMTHIMHVVTFWYPAYYLEAIIVAITGVVSFGAFIAFIPATYYALKLTSPEKLQKANQELSEEIKRRAEIEAELIRKTLDFENKQISISKNNLELTRVNKLMIDRELEMIELKKQLEALRHGNGIIK